MLPNQQFHLFYVPAVAKDPAGQHGGQLLKVVYTADRDRQEKARYFAAEVLEKSVAKAGL